MHDLPFISHAFLLTLRRFSLVNNFPDAMNLHSILSRLWYTPNLSVLTFLTLPVPLRVVIQQ